MIGTICNLCVRYGPLKNGSPYPKLVEHPIVVKQGVPVQWKLPNLDLMELANKYWIQSWSLEKLGKHYSRAPETIRKEICYQRVAARKGQKPWVEIVKKSKRP